MSEYRSPYSTYSESMAVVEETLEVLRCSPYRLCDLTGLPQRYMAYNWRNGEYRPSQKYLVRMNRLLTMVILKDIRPYTIERIEWPAGTIIYRNDVHGKSLGPLPSTVQVAPSNPVAINADYQVPTAERFLYPERLG